MTQEQFDAAVEKVTQNLVHLEDSNIRHILLQNKDWIKWMDLMAVRAIEAPKENREIKVITVMMASFIFGLFVQKEMDSK